LGRKEVIFKKIICGKAPLRLGLAGGGTDLNEVFEKYGGCVINATIDKYVHADVSYDTKTTLNGKEPDDFTKEILKKMKVNNVKITTWCEIPWGRGLGSSSAYSVLIAKLVTKLQNKEISDKDLAKLVYGIENSLGKCGWQDQYASIKGGFNWMYFDKTGKIIYTLRLNPEIIRNLEENLCLVYTGITHNSGMVQASRQEMTEDNAKKLIKLAEEARDCLFEGKINLFGKILKKGWELKKCKAIISPEVNKLMKLGLSYGAEGGKVSGAGKGGYILFFIPSKQMSYFREKIKEQKYEILDFKFTDKGVETWYI
jgi:D-glycero-alpha-D-manno-heptose-7-phosphate kinase